MQVHQIEINWTQVSAPNRLAMYQIAAKDEGLIWKCSHQKYNIILSFNSQLLCFPKLSNVKNLDHDQWQMHNCRKRDSRKILQRSCRYSIAPVLATCNRMHKRRLSCFERDWGFLRKYEKKWMTYYLGVIWVCILWVHLSLMTMVIRCLMYKMSF